MATAAALAAAAILAALAVFQARLAAGRPLGRFAWGGAHDVLPPPLRVASAASVLVYALIALVLLDAAEVTTGLPGDWSGPQSGSSRYVLRPAMKPPPAARTSGA